MTADFPRGCVRAEYDLRGFPFVVIADNLHILQSWIRPDALARRMLYGIPAGENSITSAAGIFVDVYCSGNAAPVPPCDLSSFTAHERSVFEECMRVGFGDTISYGTLARAAGFPRAARFAGSCMRKNLFPLFIPCHRVVPSSGGIGLYSGGEDIKAALLSFEKAQIR